MTRNPLQSVDGRGRSAAPRAFFLLVFGMLMVWGAHAHALGKGPVGIWPASERFALVADSSLPGIVLVDLQLGVPVERLIMERGRPIDVTSCAQCDFLLVTSRREGTSLQLVRLSGTVSSLLEKQGRLGFDKLRYTPLTPKSDGTPLTDPRIAVLSEDGSHGFVASYNDNTVFRLDLGDDPSLTPLIRSGKHLPYGVDRGSDGSLLVTMHKREIWRINDAGRVAKVYDIEKAGCPGTEDYNPNLRGALDDPSNDDAILVLASNPRSYDAVIWRLSTGFWGRQKCETVVGSIGTGSGWLDGTGSSAMFSRPHRFALRPNATKPTLLVTDIDNRALRRVDLETGQTSTIMYDRDRRIVNMAPDALVSDRSCAETGWKDAKKVRGIAGTAVCVRMPDSDARPTGFEQAAAYCKSQGARLCEPAELRAAGLGGRVRAWTIARCASCWQRDADDTCDETIVTYKSPGLKHRDEAFRQSWKSGQALEIGADPDVEPLTLCTAVEDEVTAFAPCCADESGRIPPEAMLHQVD